MPRYLPVEFKDFESFLGCYYFDEDIFEDEEYKSTAISFVKENGNDYVESVIDQAEKIMNSENFNFEGIKDASNRNFSSFDDAKRWLRMILNEIKITYAEKRRIQD